MQDLLLDGVVKEIRKQIVVQIIFDIASAYKAAQTMFMEKRKHLYWTSYVVHCIDLISKKFIEFPQHKSALQKAKKISKFNYIYSWVLALI